MLVLPDNLKTISAGTFSSGDWDSATYVKKLVLGKNLEVIGSNSFAMSKVEEIDFSRNEKLHTISNYAFRDHNMKTLTLPTTVKTIGDEAFKSNLGIKNDRLEEVNIPENLNSLGKEAFHGHSIKNITDENGNIVGDGKTLEIPEGVTEIGESAFLADIEKGKGLIEKVIIPDTVTVIGKLAFFGNSIKEIEIPSSVTKLPSDILDNNQFVPGFLTIWGTPGSRAHAIALEKGYTFNEGEMPRPEQPSEPSDNLDWSFGNPDVPFTGVVPSVSVMGGKKVTDIKISKANWVEEETTVTTEFGDILLKSDGKGNTLVSIPEGLGDKDTDEEVAVEYNGVNFMNIKVNPTPKLDFTFGI